MSGLSRSALGWAGRNLEGLPGLAAHLSHFEAMQGRRTRPRKERATLALLLLTALLACAPKAPESWAPLIAPSFSYSASAACTLVLGEREFRASGGCAADSAQGARVELRDPIGATLLLIIVTPARGILLSPDKRLSFAWTEAGREMPWSPSDLMALFAGPPRGSDKAPSEKAVTIFHWKNGRGRVTGEFTPTGGPLAFSAASLRGPGHASLSLRLDSVRPEKFGPEVFRLPEGLATEPSTPAQILKEVSP